MVVFDIVVEIAFSKCFLLENIFSYFVKIYFWHKHIKKIKKKTPKKLIWSKKKLKSTAGSHKQTIPYLISIKQLKNLLTIVIKKFTELLNQSKNKNQVI
jgi:hypothetical protein